MASKGLADYLEQLSARGDLVRISVPVAADLELAEITRRVAARGGPALLFESPGSASIAVVANLWGTPKRVGTALGIDSLDELAGRLEAAIAEHTPLNWFDRLKLAGDDTGLEKLRPKAVKQAPCQQVVHLGRDVLLASFPFPRFRPQDAGPSVTAGLCVTESPQSQQRGVTRLTLVALDANRLAVCDGGNSAFARHFREHEALGERMAAAVVLGGDPALVPLSNLVLPAAIDLWHLAGILRGRALEVAKCRTHALEVPADAELILEGYVEPEAGNATGPVFHVAAVTQRTRATVPVIVPMDSAGDLATLLALRERALLPQLRTLHASIRDFSLPAAGGPHAFAVVSLADASAGLVRQVAAALWGTDPLRLTRYLVIVDDDVDVQNQTQVLAAIGRHATPERDLFTFEGPAYTSDATAGEQLSRHVGIDATRKLRAAGTPGVVTATETEQLVTARWAEYGLR